MVTGDGAVGKVHATMICSGNELADTEPDMSTDILHHQCLPRRIHTYSVSHLLEELRDSSSADDDDDGKL